MTVLNLNFFSKNDIKNDLNHLYAAIENGLLEDIGGIESVDASDLEEIFESMTWSIARCSDLTTARNMVHLGINLMALYRSLNTVIEEIKGGHDFITGIEEYVKKEFLEKILEGLIDISHIKIGNRQGIPKNADFRGLNS